MLPNDVRRRIARAVILVVECGDLFTAEWEVRKAVVSVLVMMRKHVTSEADRAALLRAAEIVAGKLSAGTSPRRRTAPRSSARRRS